MVKPKVNLVKFEGTIEEFIKEIKVKHHACLKRPEGRKIYHYSWNNKEKWFLTPDEQMSNSNKVKAGEGTLIAKDLPTYFRYFTGSSLGYEMYLIVEEKK